MLLTGSGCIGGLVAKIRSAPAPRTTTAAKRDWPSSLPGKTHIVEGVYAMNPMGMENILWYGPDKYYYKLTFRTWYRSLMSRGGWMEVSTVPSAFRSIPRGHARYRLVKDMPAQ